MGSLTDALHIKPETADHIALILLLYMLAASYTLLYREWQNRSQFTRDVFGVSSIQGGSTAATEGREKAR